MALIGNKVTEKDLRDYLDESGYAGWSAEFQSLELVAVQRPGWLQVFSFDARVRKQTGEWTQLYGACRDDERYKRFEVALAERSAQRDATITAWSQGLIALNRRRSDVAPSGPLMLFAVVLLFFLATLLIRALV